MKGIIGTIGAVEVSELQKMGISLAHRGSPRIQACENYSLGQLDTCHTVSPFHKLDITVISDSRIDNKSQLCKMAGINTPYTEISANELIFTAYSKLGIAFAEHLIGDFTIAIVDERIKKVFLIRDHMGVRPLYYFFEEGKFLVFASEAKALLTLSIASKGINRAKLEEYLHWPTDFRAYGKETYYEGICAVIPATILSFDLDLSTCEEIFYWRIDPNRFAYLTNTSLIIEACQKLFEQAVNRRLQNLNGVHVSGGLDSSSVYKVAEKLARHRQLFTVHFFPDHPDSDEREFAEHAVPKNPENHYEIRRNTAPISDFVDVQSYIERPDPSTIPTATKVLPELKYFKRKGVSVILTGHDGDTVIDTGGSYLIKLITESKFRKFNEYFSKNTEALQTIKTVLLKLALKKKYNQEGLFSFLKLLTAAASQQFISFQELITLGLSYVKGPLKNKLFRRNTNRINRINKRYIPHNLEESVQDHFSRIYSGGMIEINEILNLSGAAFGIEYAHPFLDKDFIELSLALPETMRLGPEGMNRYYFREAMKGTLPEPIRLRKSKSLFNVAIALNLISMIDTYLDDGACDLESKDQFIRGRRAIQNTLHDPRSCFRITKKFQRALLASIWKTEIETKPADSL
ncbi:asparagine synthase-related protein [Dyadobacter tibetensis]|uniref:asparagine synthase-related protein n=1 Tax=Dyadobacter tibetensis TaxID=1211851 RepID=UPI0004722518|nr:asparagine synthase-related protein [Dyadobacter tibetensis]